jgi:hypothetical protein
MSFPSVMITFLLRKRQVKRWTKHHTLELRLQ